MDAEDGQRLKVPLFVAVDELSTQARLHGVMENSTPGKKPAFAAPSRERSP